MILLDSRIGIRGAHADIVIKIKQTRGIYWHCPIIDLLFLFFYLNKPVKILKKANNSNISARAHFLWRVKLGGKKKTLVFAQVGSKIFKEMESLCLRHPF